MDEKLLQMLVFLLLSGNEFTWKNVLKARELVGLRMNDEQELIRRKLIEQIPAPGSNATFLYKVTDKGKQWIENYSQT